MAKEDYDVAERVDWQDGPVTALGRVSETVNETPDEENKAEAAAANVKDAAYIGYADALEAHQSREDIETLAARRAREYGADFDAGEFMRQVPNRSGGNGYAPGPDAPIAGEDGGSSAP